MANCFYLPVESIKAEMTENQVLDDAYSQEAESGVDKKHTIPRNALAVLIFLLILVALIFISTRNYLLFHSIAEVFSIVIAFAIFAIAWNTRNVMDNRYFLFIGIAFLFVASFALLHTLTFKGMGIFPETPSDPNLSVQLWVATRVLLAASFLLPIFMINRKIKPVSIVVGYCLASALLLVSIFLWQNFPLVYDVTAGKLTTFKVAIEYAISIVILCAMALLIRNRRHFSKDVYQLLLIAMGLAVATEMAFTLYTDVYGIMNMVGHLVNVVSFYFIYRALVETSLTKPYALLFHNIKKSEKKLARHAEELTHVNMRLKEEITQRETVEEELRQSEERLQLKLDSVLSPDVELGEQDLANIIDVSSLQTTMEGLYSATARPFVLLDLKGKVLVSTGWQDICRNFHRVNPETCKICIETDRELAGELGKGKIHLYKCKNNLWNIVTPLYVGDKHVGNVYSGQFFFDDQLPDPKVFIAQAKKYGFEKTAYMNAFNRVPRYSRQGMEDLMTFYARFAEMLSKLSHANLKLAKSLANQKELQTRLEEKAAEVEKYASQMERLAEDRAKQLKDAERLSAIGATAGMVGHDIRNPLQAITSDLYLATMELKSLPEGETKQNLLDSIHGIEDNLFYINKIVADLQDFAKPLNPKKEAVDVQKTVHDALDMVQIPPSIRHNIVIKENLPVLTADSTMIKRVLVNLIQNAVQAMHNGGELTISVNSRKHNIEISVQDTGEGIPHNVQTKIFTPLMTTKAKGQGFGLAVVKRMTEAMGGTVTFETQPGEGTKFTLNFPGQTATF
jgi:signal transduction histidine kinase/PAS domain-containing protein